MKFEYTYLTKDESITVYVEGEAFTALKTHPNYDRITKGIVKGIKPKKLKKLFNITEAIDKYTGKDIIIEGGVLKYKGQQINNFLTRKILRMMEEGFPIDPMINFFINLRQNPSKAAQDELMLFMEANEMPVTPDGYFISYKSVRDDYKDYHSGTFDNSVGSICEMERLDVDDNRQNTCSHGLHIGAKDYAGGFGGSGHLMIVKVNPRDVVSIPHDYNNMKGRVCRYEVIDEVPKQTSGADKYNQTSVVNYEEAICPYCGSDDIDSVDQYCYSCEQPY